MVNNDRGVHRKIGKSTFHDGTKVKSSFCITSTTVDGPKCAGKRMNESLAIVRMVKMVVLLWQRVYNVLIHTTAIMGTLAFRNSIRI